MNKKRNTKNKNKYDKLNKTKYSKIINKEKYLISKSLSLNSSKDNITIKNSTNKSLLSNIENSFYNNYNSNNISLVFKNKNELFLNKEQNMFIINTSFIDNVALNVDNKTFNLVSDVFIENYNIITRILCINSDLIGVCYDNGMVFIYNMLIKTIVYKFKHISAVMLITYIEEKHVIVTSSKANNIIYYWDLNAPYNNIEKQSIFKCSDVDDDLLYFNSINELRCNTYKCNFSSKITQIENLESKYFVLGTTSPFLYFYIINNNNTIDILSKLKLDINSNVLDVYVNCIKCLKGKNVFILSTSTYNIISYSYKFIYDVEENLCKLSTDIISNVDILNYNRINEPLSIIYTNSNNINIVTRNLELIKYNYEDKQILEVSNNYTPSKITSISSCLLNIKNGNFAVLCQPNLICIFGLNLKIKLYMIIEDNSKTRSMTSFEDSILYFTCNNKILSYACDR